MSKPGRLLFFIVLTIILFLFVGCGAAQQEDCIENIMSNHQYEAILRVREGEVLRMLMNLDFVDTAAIELTLCNASTSSQTSMPIAAAVYVDGPRILTTEDSDVIALMVSRMMYSLSAENVYVFDGMMCSDIPIR